LSGTTLRRQQAEAMNAIEKWANDEFRSVNGQILYLLDNALKKSGRLPSRKKYFIFYSHTVSIKSHCKDTQKLNLHIF
jgi:hypothetical protein